ncbi:MAG: hypothetical protein AAGG09_19935 [Pseudomonadota bacterium]
MSGLGRRRRGLGLAALVGAALALAGCNGTSVGVSYGYDDPFYWNHYYYGRDVDIDVEVRPPDRPDRPERPPNVRPPVAKPLPARPPTHRPARPGGGGRLR